MTSCSSDGDEHVLKPLQELAPRTYEFHIDTEPQRAAAAMFRRIGVLRCIENLSSWWRSGKKDTRKSTRLSSWDVDRPTLAAYYSPEVMAGSNRLHETFSDTQLDVRFSLREHFSKPTKSKKAPATGSKAPRAMAVARPISIELHAGRH